MSNIYEIHNANFRAIVSAENPAKAMQNLQDKIEREPKKYKDLQGITEETITIRKLREICEIILTREDPANTPENVSSTPTNERYARSMKEPQFD